MNYSQLLREIDAELQLEYQVGAFEWIDQNFNNAWTKESETFSRALERSIERGEPETGERQSRIYKQKTLAWLREYKLKHHIDNAKTFLDGLASQTDNHIKLQSNQI